MSRIATGDHDLIILPNSSFKLLAPSPETAARLIHREIVALRAYLEEIPKDEHGSNHRTVKEIQRALNKLEVSSKARTEDFFSQTPENSGCRRRQKKEEDTSPSNKDSGDIRADALRFGLSSFRLCDLNHKLAAVFLKHTSAARNWFKSPATALAALSQKNRAVGKR